MQVEEGLELGWRSGRDVALERRQLFLRGQHAARAGLVLHDDALAGDGARFIERHVQQEALADAQGHIAFRSVKPAGYPIPIGGP